LCNHHLICSILNKLTPDNFDKLSNQLAQYIAGSNREVLSGAILLIFEKAIDEAKYSFMYGRLCLKLNDLATNFEDPNSKTTTFRRLLLSKCKGEFENRTKIVSTNEQDDLSSERSEYRDVFRRKMLGNVKFIGELFKLGMLHEAVVHQCIKQLLEKRRSLPELCDNIECVCNLLYTVGYLLDTDKAKSWMDKYFERMEVLSRTNDFPPRIRFMIMNTTELRRDQWRPRHRKYNEVPKPLERSPVSYRPHPHLITKPLPPKVDEEKTNLQAQSVTPPIKSIKLPSAKKTDSTNVSLRPSIPPAKFQQQKFNTSDVKSQTTPPPDDGGRRHTIPRTRDDSSDEDEVAPPFLKSHSNQLAPPHLPPAHPVVPYYRGLIRPPNPHPGHPYPPPHMFAPPHPLTYPSLARYMGPPMSWPHPSLYPFPPPQQPTNEMVVKNKSETPPITKKSNRKGMVSNKVIEQSEEERKIVK
jgi:translation initiation factor 4G